MLSEIEILESTYTDLCKIERNSKVKDPITGVTSTKLMIISEDLKCALSKDKRTNLMSVDGTGNIKESYLLFINPTSGLKAGDKLTITSLNGNQIFTASQPFTYSSHTECYLTYEERV